MSQPDTIKNPAASAIMTMSIDNVPSPANDLASRGRALPLADASDKNNLTKAFHIRQTLFDPASKPG